MNTVWLDVYQMIMLGFATSIITYNNGYGWQNSMLKLVLAGATASAGLQMLIGMGYVIPAFQGTM